MWHLVLRNILRAPIRNGLVLLSTASAFVLLVVLSSIIDALDDGLESDPHLRILSARSYGHELAPFSEVARIKALPDIIAVTPDLGLPAYFRDRRNYVVVVAVLLEEYANIFDVDLTANVLACTSRTPLALIATPELARQHGWRVGDPVPLTSTMHMTSTGSKNWPFVFCGEYRSPKETGHTLLARFDQVADYDLYPGRGVGSLYARVADPNKLEETALLVDALFEHERYAKRSMALNAFERELIGRYADIGTLATIILGAVFFALVLMAASVGMQAIRERLPELAVVRTLGFSNGAIVSLIVLETLLLSVSGAVLGVVAAYALEPLFLELLRDLVGRFEYQGRVVAHATALAALIGLLTGVSPSFRAVRLPVATALREDGRLG